MLESLHEHCPQAHIHVLCLSAECDKALRQLQYSFVSLYSQEDLESADPDLLAVRPTRSLVEYYFTFTPCLPHFLLHALALPEITYLDADMMFFSSLDPIFEEAGNASILITPHRFSPHLAGRDVYGIYNVSWLTFRNTEDGKKCLSWYRSACLDWCYDRVEPGRFADQKYLDFFPEKFMGVHALRHEGAGVAPWNIHDVFWELKDEGAYINGVPLIFYHAQSFKHLLWQWYDSGLAGYNTSLTRENRQAVFKPYLERFHRARMVAQRQLSLFPANTLRYVEKSSRFAPWREIYTLYRQNSLLWQTGKFFCSFFSSRSHKASIP